MHIVWNKGFAFQIIVSSVKGQQNKIHIDTARILVDDFLIEGPGEYEIKNIFIEGIAADNSPIYTIETEEMRLCHLGDFVQKELTAEQLDKIGEIDILMVPADNPKIISQIEPRIVIPMNYSKLDQFLKAMGRKKIEPLPKLLIKKKDLPEEETKIVVLQHGR